MSEKWWGQRGQWGKEWGHDDENSRKIQLKYDDVISIIINQQYTVDAGRNIAGKQTSNENKNFKALRPQVSENCENQFWENQFLLLSNDFIFLQTNFVTVW